MHTPENKLNEAYDRLVTEWPLVLERHGIIRAYLGKHSDVFDGSSEANRDVVFQNMCNKIEVVINNRFATNEGG